MSQIIRQDYIDKILKHRNMGFVTILTGIRYSGKSTILKQTYDYLKNTEDIPEENIKFIDFKKRGFDNKDNANFLCEQLDFLKCEVKADKYLFIDNIDFVKNWEGILYSGCKYVYGLNVYIAPFYSNYYINKDILKIHSRKIQVFPFSFKEYIEYHDLNTDDKLSQWELFEKYQQFGGLPEVLESDDDEHKHQIRKWSYQNTIYPAIWHLYYRDFAKSLIKYIIKTSGHKFDYRIFHKFVNKDSNCNLHILNLSQELLEYYMAILKNTEVICSCGCIDFESDDLKWHEQIYYVVDPSFYFECSYNLNSKEIFESMVYTELLRRNYDVSKGLFSDGEIIFVHKQDNNWVYIQVEKSLEDEKTRNKIFNNFKRDKNAIKYVISADTKNYSTDEYEHINIIDFLKNKKLITGD